MANEEHLREYASPPCYQHEFDDSPGKLPPDVAAILNELLQGERAGAMAIITMNAVADGQLGSLLKTVAEDEARFCAMLHRHLTRLGHVPSRGIGVFYEKLVKRPTLDEKLRLLDRGQSAVVRMLDGVLSSIEDAALREDLEEMRTVHVRNIEACAKYVTTG
ncbi:MAG: DUF6306 domain-containing protein [Pseudomonadales bacterium]|nr:hypothetical protein [Pseudomonadales bacterium]